jgi:hypothetical protein
MFIRYILSVEVDGTDQSYWIEFDCDKTVGLKIINNNNINSNCCLNIVTDKLGGVETSAT